MKINRAIWRFALGGVALVLVALGAVSCGDYIEKSVAFETVEKVSYVRGVDFRFDLRVRNDLSFPIAIKSGRVTLKFRGQDLASLTLQEAVAIEPKGVQSVATTWRLTGDLVGVMSRLGRHAMSQQSTKELFIDYEIKVSAKGVTKSLESQNIPIDTFSFNFQNLF